MKTPQLLPIKHLEKRHHGVTLSAAADLHEAACVCLSRHYSPPVQVTLSDNGIDCAVEIFWDTPNDRTLAARANKNDTTAAGAYGCVIAAVEVSRGLFAVRRAETGTGADYYVGPQGTGVNDLEDCQRLEVSGVSDGGKTQVLARVLQKIRQAQNGASSLPAIAGVIGFAAKLLVLRDVPEEP